MTMRVGSSATNFGHKVGKISVETESWNRILKTGTVKVGYANERPFAFKTNGGSPIQGESWDIADWVLRTIGIQRIEPVLTDFWSLIPQLKNGAYDLIAAGFYITPIRFRDINFSFPTYQNKEGLVVAKGNPLHLKTFADIIRHPFAKIAVLFGSATASHIRLYHLPPSRVIQFTSTAEALLGLANQEADLFLTSSISLHNALENSPHPTIELVPEFPGFIVNGHPMVDYGAFGFRKDDHEFRNRFNAALHPFIGSDEHLKRVAPYGFCRLDVPQQLPIEILNMVTV